MHRLLCTALLLLYCVYGCIAADVVQTLPQKGKGPLDRSIYLLDSRPVKNEERWFPMRIGVFPDGVNEVLNYCRGGNSVTSILGGLISREADYKRFCNEFQFSGDIAKLLVRSIIPSAVKLHTDRLSVQRSSRKLVVPRLFSNSFSLECLDAVIPEKHHTEGIGKVDFALYVGLSRFMTSAVVCSEDLNRRPTSALISFYPKDIVNTRQFIRITAHEIAHGLGFDRSRMDKLQMVVHRTVSGVKVSEVRSETLATKVKEHYGCDNAGGMFLENEGLRVNSHWERRIAKDDLMSSYSSDEPSGMYYTSLTLAVFDSMSFYKANFSMAESMSWGKNAGCELLGVQCIDENITKYSNMFCTQPLVSLQCTSDRFSLGRCTSNDFPQDFPEDYIDFGDSSQTHLYSQLTDGCHIIRPLNSTRCLDGDPELMPGSLVGNTSRCLKGNELKQSISSQGFLPIGDICANVKCEDGKVKVQYKGSNKWHDCTDGGSIEKLEGSEFTGGSILCPNYTEVCTDLSQTSGLIIESDEFEDTGVLGDYIIGGYQNDTDNEINETVDNNDDSDNMGTGNTTCTVGDCEKHPALDGSNNSITASYFGPFLLLLFIVAVMVSS